MIHAVFRYVKQYRRYLPLFIFFGAGLLSAFFLRIEFGFSSLFFYCNAFDLPKFDEEFLFFIASLGKKPLCFAILLLISVGGPLFSVISLFLLMYRGFTTGWCLSVLSNTPGERFFPVILVAVYILESFLYILLIIRLHQQQKQLICTFFPITGLILLLHIAVPLILRLT